MAAQGGHTEVVKLLLQRGADVSIAAEEGATALTNAVSNDKADVAFLLVDAGADPNDGYVDGNARERKLLPDAIGANNDHFASLLVRKGATCSNNLFLQAAHRGLNDTIKAMLQTNDDRDSKRNCPVDPAFANSEAVTGLIAAASEGHLDVVRHVVTALLPRDDALTHLDAADKDGTTSLMAAAVRGHRDVVEFLVANGCDLNKQNKEGHTALMFAYNGRAQVMTLLDKYVAVVEAKTTTRADREPSSEEDASSSSSEKSPEPRKPDTNLEIINTALATHSAIVEHLLQKGANPDLVDNQGNKAIDFDYTKEEDQQQQSDPTSAGNERNSDDSLPPEPAGVGSGEL